MKSLDQMQFVADVQRDGRYVGRVLEFRDLFSKPKVSRLDALDEIIALTSMRLRELDESRGKAR
jgi:hypothetical protein